MTEEGGAFAPPPAETAAEQPALVDITEFTRIQLRVGCIEAAENVPKSKKLVKLQVNLGDRLGTRQVLAGIAQFYEPAALVGQRVIIVANLKPAVLMGHESKGMLLAGASDDDSILKIIHPDPALPLGAVVR